MKSEAHLSKSPAKDRAELREELLRSDPAASDRLHVFDALNRESDDEVDVPDMPEGLRDQLADQFGERTPRSIGSEVARPGIIAVLGSFFKTNPLSAYGGLAAAACAIMFMFLQSGDPQGGTDTDRLRGGAGGAAVTAEVPILLFPQEQGQAVAAMMSSDREVLVFADAAEMKARLPDGLAVAVDLGRREVIVFEAGQVKSQHPVEGEGERGVLLAIRAALDDVAK